MKSKTISSFKIEVSREMIDRSYLFLPDAIRDPDEDACRKIIKIYQDVLVPFAKSRGITRRNARNLRRDIDKFWAGVGFPPNCRPRTKYNTLSGFLPFFARAQRIDKELRSKIERFLLLAFNRHPLALTTSHWL
jgi:hypothetical protein